MLKTSKPAAAFSINMPGDIGVHGARCINRARFPAGIRNVRRLPDRHRRRRAVPFGGPTLRRRKGRFAPASSLEETRFEPSVRCETSNFSSRLWLIFRQPESRRGRPERGASSAVLKVRIHLSPAKRATRRRRPIPSFTGLTEVSKLLREQCAEQRDREFADSPLEEDGFELVVPPRTKRLREGPGGSHLGLGPDLNWFRFSCRRPGWPASSRALCRSGTGGSNPVRSSGESGTNLTPLSDAPAPWRSSQ
jgi:hypothetical protein